MLPIVIFSVRNVSAHDVCPMLYVLFSPEIHTIPSNLRVDQNGWFVINPVYPGGGQNFGIGALLKPEKCNL